VKLGSYEKPDVTRRVILKIEFDGKETVWCPIGDFFGSGIGLNPMQGWYRTVAEDGTMTCRWVMPYKTGGKVSLVNLSDDAVDATLEVKTSDWKWDDRSMYFHAGWRGQYPVSTRPRSDWNYINVKGRGVYVGSNDFYEHPFHAQPRVHEYNKLNRKPTGKNQKNVFGFSVETRSRALDTIPFNRSLQLDMEVWHWLEVQMGYGVGAYWYGFGDTTSNHKPDPKEVANVPVIPDKPVTKKKKK